MIYIVTEDNTSALSFWKEFMKRSKEPYEFVLETLMNNGELKLGGNGTLKTQIRYVDKHIKAKDTLFIAFDTVSLGGTYKPGKSASNTKDDEDTKNGFNPAEVIRMGNNLCKRKDCKFIYTLYYCFEEIFIMSDELVNLCSSMQNQTMYKLMVDMHNKIKANQFNYEECKKDKMYKEIIDKSNTTNREQLANVILLNCTQSIKFKINKKDKIFEVTGDAACWIQECNDTQKEFLKRSVQYKDSRCNNCTYKYKNCSNDIKVTSIASSRCKNCINYIK